MEWSRFNSVDHTEWPKPGLLNRRLGAFSGSSQGKFQKIPTKKLTECSGVGTPKLGEGKWGRKKYRHIPKCEGDSQGQVPTCSLPGKLFKTRDLELPIFEGSLPSCSPHSPGYTRTFLHPYFPVANQNSLNLIYQESPQQTKPKKGPKRKVHEFRPFL